MKNDGPDAYKFRGPHVVCRAMEASLRAEVRELRKRIRLARGNLAADRAKELREYAHYYLDHRGVIGEWHGVATVVRAYLKARDVLDLRRPLPKRGRR